MKKPTRVASGEAIDNAQLFFEDDTLRGKYSVMEIATLAAGCRGETNPERIRNAVRLLAQVETYARLGKEITTLVMQGSTIDSPGKSNKRAATSSRSDPQYMDMLLTILDRVRHDATTGKIERTSLVGLCCEQMNACKGESPHANRLYSQWLKREAWLQGEDIATRKAHYECGTNPALIHDRRMAGALAMCFLGWLENRRKRPPSKPIRSRKRENKGQIVSPKTKGAGRAEDGTYQ